MQMTTNKIDGANATISATIANETIETTVNKIAKDLTKTAKIDGFRKGKVPVSAIKKQYGERLVQDAEAEVLRKLLDDALAEMEIAADSLIGEPSITKFDKTDAGIEVEVKIAMRPEVDLGEYSELVETFEKPAVSDEEITTRIKELAQAQAPLVDVEEDRAAENGDSVVIDFVGSVNGELFEGGSAKDFSLVLGSGQFIPGFEDQVIGMKTGESKDINVTFPESYGGKELAGKDAVFAVTLHKIQTKGEIALDDELAKKMLPGEEDASYTMLQEKVKEQIESEKLSELYNNELKPALLEKFVAEVKFDLPEFVVEQEIDMALNKHAQTLSEDELNAIKDDAEKVKELRETFRDDAAKSVKATFIIDTLAAKEDVKVEEQEVMQTIYYEAMQTGQDPAATYKQYQESGYLPAVQMAMMEDKVLSKLLNSKIKEA